MTLAELSQFTFLNLFYYYYYYYYYYQLLVVLFSFLLPSSYCYYYYYDSACYFSHSISNLGFRELQQLRTKSQELRTAGCENLGDGSTIEA